MSNTGIHVVKRDGTSAPLDIQKIHNVIEWACNGYGDGSLSPVKGVSASEVEMAAELHLHDGISTKEIHQVLINAAEALITEKNPNYDRVAARLRWFAVRKEAFGSNFAPKISEVVKINTDNGLYDPAILSMYSEEEWKAIDAIVDHRRDDLFKNAGALQMSKKYLVQNRKTKQVYETFQAPYALVSATLFGAEQKDKRLKYVKRYYDLTSQHVISLPTPIMAGLRTKVKQFSSCTLIEAGDSLKSITSAATAIVDYASRKAGIGINVGRIRAAGQPVRGGDAVTTGVIPFARFLTAALKSCSQGAVRGASATINWPAWHLEFESLIELKNNKGTEDTRLRNVDYCVHMNETLYRRVAESKSITLFSPEEVPDLYEAFYGPADKFEALYVKYEKDPKKTKKTLPAREFFSKIVSERFGTGRIYILNADNVNTQSSFYEPLTMTNLCTEITLPVRPMGEEDEMIALCTLSALNWGKISTDAEMADAAEMAVRGLDALLDYQDYPNEAARRGAMKYRPLGIGIIGFAHWLAKNKLKWGSAETLKAVAEKTESMAWHLTHASIMLAKEKGACPGHTKYHDGIFPVDNAKVKVELKKDWEYLRGLAKRYGIRNATLMAIMPSETSSQLANETNGIEPPLALVSSKGNKEALAPQVVPEIAKLAKWYELAWDVSVPNYLKTIARIQPFVDQAISANTNYNPAHMKDGTIRSSELAADVIQAWAMGVKTLYYCNTLDDAEEEASTESGPPPLTAVAEPANEGDGCESGACVI
jgi:ribonucleoside-diphosphate reductase alpha chain